MIPSYRRRPGGLIARHSAGDPSCILLKIAAMGQANSRGSG